MTMTSAPATSRAEAGPPAWLTAQRTLAGVLVVGFAFVQLVLAGEVIPPLLILSVLLAGALALSRTRPRVGVIAIGAVALVAVVGNLPFVSSDLAHPASFVNFTVNLALLVAAVTAAIGGGATLARRVSPRPVVLGAAALVVVGTIASAGAAAGVKDEAPRSGDVAIVAHDIAFSPRHVEVDHGGTLRVVNRDPVPHDLTVDGTGVEVDIEAGTARRVAVSLAPGEYAFHCDLPGHDDMKGTLVVR